MTLGEAIAGTMQRDGFTVDAGTPVSHRSERAAAIDIRPIMARRERVGLNRAEAIPRVTSERRIVEVITAKATKGLRMPIAA